MRFLTFFLLSFFLFTATTVQAQSKKREAFIEKAATYVCGCFDEKKANDDAMNSEMAIGLCMLNFLNENPAGAKMAFGEYSITNEADMIRIGEELGLRMAGVCPETLLSLVDEEDLMAEEQEAASTSTLEGELVGVTFGEQTVVTLRKSNGQPVKLYWLEYFPGSDMLMDGSKMEGKTLTVTYRNVELFSGADREYYTRKVLTKVAY